MEQGFTASTQVELVGQEASLLGFFAIEHEESDGRSSVCQQLGKGIDATQSGTMTVKTLHRILFKGKKSEAAKVTAVGTFPQGPAATAQAKLLR